MRGCGARKSPSCASIWAGSAAVCPRPCSRSSRPPNSAWPEAAGARRPSDFFAGEVDGRRRALLGQAPQPDHALALDLQAVAAHERLLAVSALHERAAGALIDQYELAAADLGTPGEARNPLP